MTEEIKRLEGAIANSKCRYVKMTVPAIVAEQEHDIDAIFEAAQAHLKYLKRKAALINPSITREKQAEAETIEEMHRA
jgi:hypothetical protein